MSEREPRDAGARTHKRLDILLLDIGQVMRVPVSVWGEHGVLQHAAECEVGDVMQSNPVPPHERIEPFGLALQAFDEVHIKCLHARKYLHGEVERDDAIFAAA